MPNSKTTLLLIAGAAVLIVVTASTTLLFARPRVNNRADYAQVRREQQVRTGNNRKRRQNSIRPSQMPTTTPPVTE
jgi:hypothetical protein